MFGDLLTVLRTVDKVTGCLSQTGSLEAFTARLRELVENPEEADRLREALNKMQRAKTKIEATPMTFSVGAGSSEQS